MKNKKGFTLIELLAIIVILAIIAVITVPIILNIIENSRKGAATDSAYGYKDAVNKYYVSELYNNKDLQLNGEYTVTNGVLSGTGITNVEIPVSGSIPSSGSLTYSNNVLTSGCLVIGEYAVTFTNGETTTVKGTCGENTSGGSTSEPAVTPPVAVGDTVTIGSESFYVISISNGNATLLADNCLIETSTGVYRQKTSSDTASCLTTTFSSTNYWNDSSTNTPKSDYQSDLNGTVVTTYTSPYPYIYYVKGSDTNNVDDIVNAYVGTVSSNASGRLMSYSEANGLSIEVRGIGAYYWLGSAGYYGYAWFVNSSGGMGYSYCGSNYGVRPIVILPLSEI